MRVVVHAFVGDAAAMKIFCILRLLLPTFLATNTILSVCVQYTSVFDTMKCDLVLIGAVSNLVSRASRIFL